MRLHNGLRVVSACLHKSAYPLKVLLLPSLNHRTPQGGPNKSC